MQLACLRQQPCHVDGTRGRRARRCLKQRPLPQSHLSLLSPSHNAHTGLFRDVPPPVEKPAGRGGGRKRRHAAPPPQELEEVRCALFCTLPECLYCLCCQLAGWSASGYAQHLAGKLVPHWICSLDAANGLKDVWAAVMSSTDRMCAIASITGRGACHHTWHTGHIEAGQQGRLGPRWCVPSTFICQDTCSVLALCVFIVCLRWLGLQRDDNCVQHQPSTSAR